MKVTIYIEGSTNTPELNAEADTVDNSTVFRENFYKLFSQKLSNDQFDLSIQPIGTITQARLQLKSISEQKINGVILIDLDGPKNEKQARLKANYYNLDTTKIFFMIQEMEAWILSQPSKIDDCLLKDGCIRKKQGEKIANNTLLKNKHPQDIEHPSDKLDTILSQYFDIIKKKRGKSKTSPKRYKKMKDGPNLIGHLILDELIICFDEVNLLIDYFLKK